MDCVNGYTEDEHKAMAARLDAAIALSALCMELAHAGKSLHPSDPHGVIDDARMINAKRWLL